MSKKISISAIDKVVKEMKQEPSVIDWHGNELVIQRALSLQDAITFVKAVADSCFDDDGEYMPEIMHYAIRALTIELYTNAALPSNPSHKYSILMETDLYDAVCREIGDSAQYDSLIEAIYDRIEVMSEANNAENARKINSIITELSGIVESMSSMADGINSEDVAAFVKAVSESGKFDEGKIVNAYLARRKEDRDTEDRIDETVSDDES